MSKSAQAFIPPPVEELDCPRKPMSLEELADWLGVSRRFVEVQVEKGRLRVRRISPRLVRILPGDVAKWLDNAAPSEVEA